MQFTLSDEQRMLKEGAERFFSARHPPARARLALPWSDARQPALWRDMADMGWLAVRVPESQGGLGLGVLEACLLSEAAGRHLLNLPLAASAVLAGALLPAHALAELIGGARCIAEAAHGAASADHAAQCSHLLRWGAGAASRLEARPPTASAAPGLDATMHWAPLESEVNTAPALDSAHLEAPDSVAIAGYRLALSAEALGAASAAHALACAYARERQQFGRAIGSQQGLKHPLADAWMALDNARLAIHYAAAALDAGLPDAARACAAAELALLHAAPVAAQGAIQVHGALGFTWEHDAHLYLKRVQRLALRLGGLERAQAAWAHAALAPL